MCPCDGLVASTRCILPLAQWMLDMGSSDLHDLERKNLVKMTDRWRFQTPKKQDSLLCDLQDKIDCNRKATLHSGAIHPHPNYKCILPTSGRWVKYNPQINYLCLSVCLIYLWDFFSGGIHLRHPDLCLHVYVCFDFQKNMSGCLNSYRPPWSASINSSEDSMRCPVWFYFSSICVACDLHPFKVSSHTSPNYYFLSMQFSA